MQFKQGVSVYMSDGKAIGQLDQVVVDPRTREVNYIVVRKGMFFTTDKVVPLTLVARAEDDGVVLREAAGDLERLPAFEERYYVRVDEAGAQPGAPASSTSAGISVAPTVYPYPPYIGGEMLGFGSLNSQGTVGALAIPETVLERTQRAIPDNSMAIRAGVRVVAADGQVVGAVEEILTDENADRVTHFVITHGILFKERKLIPVEWVSEIGEEELQLAVDAAILGKLPAYNPPS